MIKTNAMECHAIIYGSDYIIRATKKEDIKRLDALEMLIWRSMEKSVGLNIIAN